MGQANKKRKAPSRIRYEQSHPTVSCRVSRELYERLQKVGGTEDKSFADILKIGLGILEVKVKKEGDIRKKAYAEGHQKGYVEAQNFYMVTYPCNVCGEILTVTTEDEKKAIKQYMVQHNWGHASCHERGQ